MAEVYGLDIADLPAHYTPLEALVITECVALDETGTSAKKLVIRATDGLTTWDVIGLCQAVRADAEDQFRQATSED